MDLSRVILGSVITEKAERLKVGRSYTLMVHPDATKIDVMNALRTFFNVEPTSVRVMLTRGKSRMIGGGRSFTKRHPGKKAVVTLNEKSKGLDLAQFKVS